jgi:hypothetical protein
VEGVQRLANLGNAAPQGGCALAYVRFSERFMFWPEEPCGDGYNEEQWHGNQEFALHAALPADAWKTNFMDADTASRRQMARAGMSLTSANKGNLGIRFG